MESDDDRRARFDHEEKERARIKNEAKSDLMAVLALPAGRRVLARLIAHGEVFGTIRGCTSENYAHFEGRRHSALILIREINEISPEIMGAVAALSVNLRKENK